MVRVILATGKHDDASRVAVRGYVQSRYETVHNLPVTVGTCPDADWSKGAAVNAAARSTTEPVLVIADADSFVTPEHLDKAIDQARQHGWSMPHSVVKRLTRQATAGVLAGEPLTNRTRLERSGYPALPGGGIVVLTREAFEAVNGLDPRYRGWGGEDHAFGLALRTLVGPLQGRRVAPLWHLWHVPAPRARRPADASRNLNARYRQARDKPDVMADLVKEW